jgi:cytochrome c oxidase subunit 2
MQHPYQLYFQDAANSNTFSIYHFHDFVFIILITVLTIVGAALLSILSNSYTDRYTKEAHLLETIWTIIPAVILCFLVIPSIRILYLTEELPSPDFTVKAVGHQWYWSYEWPELDITFDSYMVQTPDLIPGDHRLLEVDNRLVVPNNTYIRVLTTSSDVIHAWAIPALSLKVDAIPGRLNQLNLIPQLLGVYYGQCSEICGANHSFIPICIEVTDKIYFLNRLKTLS